MARKQNTGFASQTGILRRSPSPNKGYAYTANRFAIIAPNFELEERLEGFQDLPFFKDNSRLFFDLQCNTAFRRYGQAFYADILRDLEDLVESFDEMVEMCG